MEVEDASGEWGGRRGEREGAGGEREGLVREPEDDFGAWEGLSRKADGVSPSRTDNREA